MPAFVRFLLLGTLLASSLAAAPDSWAKLKIGMSAGEIAALLGQPFCRSHGHGIERWIYDQGAEVLVHGGRAVIGWTAPAPLRSVVRSIDIWNDRAAAAYYAALCAARPEQAGGSRVRRPPSSAVYEDYLRG